MLWKNYTEIPKHIPKGERIMGACGISGYMNFDGTRDSGEKIKKMITVLKDRENGLGAGYAAYGIFEGTGLEDKYNLQCLFDDLETKDIVEEYIKTMGNIVKSEPIPTNPQAPTIKPPIAWRFFFEPSNKIDLQKHDDHVVDVIMHINSEISKSFVMSSGKNMGVFKGNGWSEDIADYYKIQDYKAYMWLAHSRFPTNTPGAWHSAHPFSILDWSVIHNGEVTSYGTNRRYLESFGYKCTMFTDTEVLAYLFDLLVRRHNIPIPIATIATNPPLYSKIALMDEKHQLALKNIRITYRSAMVNGPFSIIVGKQTPKPTIIALTDRKKLRPQVVAMSDDDNTIMISSEEAAIRAIVIDPRFKMNYEKVWMPKAGTAVIGELGIGVIRKGTEDPFEGYELEVVS